MAEAAIERELGIPTLLAWKHAFIPMVVFLLASLAFWYIELYVFDVMLYNYSICHFIYGAFFPFLFGYIGPVSVKKKGEFEPFKVWVKRVFSNPVKIPDLMARSIINELKRLQQGKAWSLYTGAGLTLLMAVANEMVVDPISNGVSFFSAYEHFIYDLAGIASFLFAIWAFGCMKSRIKR